MFRYCPLLSGKSNNRTPLRSIPNNKWMAPRKKYLDVFNASDECGVQYEPARPLLYQTSTPPPQYQPIGLEQYKHPPPVQSLDHKQLGSGRPTVPEQYQQPPGSATSRCENQMPYTPRGNQEFKYLKV